MSVVRPSGPRAPSPSPSEHPEDQAEEASDEHHCPSPRPRWRDRRSASHGGQRRGEDGQKQGPPKGPRHAHVDFVWERRRPGKERMCRSQDGDRPESHDDPDDERRGEQQTRNTASASRVAGSSLCHRPPKRSDARFSLAITIPLAGGLGNGADDQRGVVVGPEGATFPLPPRNPLAAETGARRWHGMALDGTQPQMSLTLRSRFCR